MELHTANSGLVRRFNEAAVLEVLRKHRVLTKTDIVKLTGLTYPTVSKSINSLYEVHLIQESGEGASRGGRPPLLYSFNPLAGLIVGVQIERKGLSFGAFDLDLRLIDSFTYQPPALEPELIIDLIRKGTEEIARKHDLTLYGVGIGSPGNVDPTTHTVISPYQLRWKNSVNLVEPLENTLEVPVSLGNDINLAALGELAASDSPALMQPMVFVSVSQGVGAGLILSDAVYCGGNGGAGEIGHISVAADGKLCECGNRGCLEGLISSGSIAQQLGVETTEAFALLRQKVDDEARDALDVYANLIKHFGTALTSVINLFNPGSIIIGGEITELGEDFLQAIRKWLTESCGNVPFLVENLKYSRLSSKACLYGAAALVEQQVFPKLRVPREQAALI